MFALFSVTIMLISRSIMASTPHRNYRFSAVRHDAGVFEIIGCQGIAAPPLANCVLRISCPIHSTSNLSFIHVLHQHWIHIVVTESSAFLCLQSSAPVLVQFQISTVHAVTNHHAALIAARLKASRIQAFRNLRFMDSTVRIAALETVAADCVQRITNAMPLDRIQRERFAGFAVPPPLNEKVAHRCPQWRSQQRADLACSASDSRSHTNLCRSYCLLCPRCFPQWRIQSSAPVLPPRRGVIPS